ncbi:MAG: sensor histidine kinase [Anaerolineae bacterium]
MVEVIQQSINDAKRLAELHRTRLLDSPPEESFDRITALASRIVKAPVSLITLIEPHRQFLKSQFGLQEPYSEQRETPIEFSFCRHVVRSGKPLIIEDAHKHPLVMNNPAIVEMNIIAYLGIPLVTTDGWNLGSLCVIDHRPRQWAEDEIETMETLAASVASEIQLRLDASEMQSLVDQLQIHNRDLDEFSHTVSHNLKNAISAIMGWADMSIRYADQIDREELLNNMHKVSDIAAQTDETINALLLLANIDRAGELDIQPLPMFELVETVLGRVELEIAERSAMVVLPDEFPDSLGYREWVEEIWLNYITNALKYGGTPPRIELGAERLDHGMVRYWVKDNGEGIAPEDHDLLFQTFSRLPKTANIEGHGLGLSIVSRIADKLGGEVAVESALNAGSVFSFTLPAPD